MTEKWTAANIADQSGRTAVVTGANSGIGFFAARELARAGARVVLAVRNAEKGAEAGRDIAAAVPGAEVEVAPLDLASLDSVRSFAEQFKAANDGLDVLINNAGVMAASPRLDRMVMAVGNRIMAQSAEMGALPLLYAATYPGLEGGTYVGPSSFFEQRGYPRPVGSSSAARDEDAARRLWAVSEELTGVQFRIPATQP